MHKNFCAFRLTLWYSKCREKEKILERTKAQHCSSSNNLEISPNKVKPFAEKGIRFAYNVELPHRTFSSLSNNRQIFCAREKANGFFYLEKRGRISTYNKKQRCCENTQVTFSGKATMYASFKWFSRIIWPVWIEWNQFMWRWCNHFIIWVYLFFFTTFLDLSI